jgi:hypothetical protein
MQVGVMYCTENESMRDTASTKYRAVAFIY